MLPFTSPPRRSHVHDRPGGYSFTLLFHTVAGITLAGHGLTSRGHTHSSTNAIEQQMGPIDGLMRAAYPDARTIIGVQRIQTRTQ